MTPFLLGKDFVGEFFYFFILCYHLNIRTRHGFVMFSVSLGRDLSGLVATPLEVLE